MLEDNSWSQRWSELNSIAYLLKFIVVSICVFLFEATPLFAIWSIFVRKLCDRKENIKLLVYNLKFMTAFKLWLYIWLTRLWKKIFRGKISQNYYGNCLYVFRSIFIFLDIGTCNYHDYMFPYFTLIKILCKRCWEHFPIQTIRPWCLM